MRTIIDAVTGEITQDDDFIPDELPVDTTTQIVTVYAIDLWSRMTDAEADQVIAAVTARSARIQNIFRAANSYRSDHELWPLLVQMATTLFGAARAAEILAPSE